MVSQEMAPSSTRVWASPLINRPNQSRWNAITAKPQWRPTRTIPAIRAPNTDSEGAIARPRTDPRITPKITSKAALLPRKRRSPTRTRQHAGKVDDHGSRDNLPDGERLQIHSQAVVKSDHCVSSRIADFSNQSCQRLSTTHAPLHNVTARPPCWTNASHLAARAELENIERA